MLSVGGGKAITGSEGDGSIVSDDQLARLNERQQEIYCEKLSRFAAHLKTKGKVPMKEIGYAEGSVRVRISRFHRMMKWVWNHEDVVTTEFTSENGDAVNTALQTDSLRKMDGGRFAEGTKRKLNDVLRNWFEFQNIDWNPKYTFSDDEPENQPDPFLKKELKQRWSRNNSDKKAKPPQVSTSTLSPNSKKKPQK